MNNPEHLIPVTLEQRADRGISGLQNLLLLFRHELSYVMSITRDLLKEIQTLKDKNELLEKENKRLMQLKREQLAREVGI